jgi:ATP-binding protein involved in chromosome partitioning
MFNKVHLPIIGLIENMSTFVCEHCGKTSHVFGAKGGEKLAHIHGVPLLTEVPLDIAIREVSEVGSNILNESRLSSYYTLSAKLMSSMLYYQTITDSCIEIVMTDD